MSDLLATMIYELSCYKYSIFGFITRTISYKCKTLKREFNGTHKKKHAIYKKEFMIPSWGRKEKKLQMTSINRIKQKTRENIFLIRKPWIPEINTPKNVINVFFDVQHIILSRYTSGVIFGTIYNPPFPRYDVRAKLEAIDQTVNKFDGTGLNKPSCRLKGQIDK